MIEKGKKQRKPEMTGQRDIQNKLLHFYECTINEFRPVWANMM